MGKMPSLFQWLRGIFGRFQRKQSSGTVRQEQGQGGTRMKGKLLGLPLPSLLRNKSSKNEDGWTTIFLAEDADWMNDSDDSIELRPIISSPKPPILPKFVKASDGQTNLKKVSQLQRNKASFQGMSAGETGPMLEEVPLAGMDCSRHLLQVAGIGDDEDEEESDDFLNDDFDDNENDRDKLLSTASSDMSILSLMQNKYEKRVKRRLKYEALHELSARVKQKLKLSGVPVKKPSASYSSLTSEGGDFKLNLPRKFYEKIGFTATKSDEKRRSTTFPWIKAVTKDLQKNAKDPASYLLSKWLGSANPRRFRQPQAEYN